MTDYKGRIFGKNVLEATFRSFYGTDLFLGELLAAEDVERARRFLFRVIDVTYGSDSSDPGWAERTAGGYMTGDVAGAPPRPPRPPPPPSKGPQGHTPGHLPPRR